MLKKERKQNHIKCSIKTTQGRKTVEDKNMNKEQRQQIKKVKTVDINLITLIITLQPTV